MRYYRVIAAMTGLLAAALVGSGAVTAGATAGEDTDGDGIENVVIETVNVARCSRFGAPATVTAVVSVVAKTETGVLVFPYYADTTHEATQLGRVARAQTRTVSLEFGPGEGYVYALGNRTGDSDNSEIFAIGECRPAAQITQRWARGVSINQSNTASTVRMCYVSLAKRDGVVERRKRTCVPAGERAVTPMRNLPAGSTVFVHAAGRTLDALLVG
jgi:hypothetical protein